MKFLKYIFLLGMVNSQFDWVDNGIAVRQGVHIEWQRTADMDQEGNFIFGWSDTRQGGRDVYVQKTNSQGDMLWGENGIVVVQSEGRQEDPILMGDGQGGAFVIWVDYKDEPEDGDIYAQYILSDGTMQWPAEGIGLATMPGKQVSPNMCSDGQGGAYVIWKDLTVSSYGHVYGTHLSSSGVLSPGTGVPILANESYHNNVSIERGPLGRAVLVWWDDSLPDDANIRTQSIDQNCNTLWSSPEEGGLLMCSANGNQLFAKVAYYNENYSVIAWEDHQLSAEFGDIHIQFLDLNGANVFEDTGLPVCSDPSNQIKPRIKSHQWSDGSPEFAAYVVWEDSRNSDTDIYSQKVDVGGNMYWQENGISIVSEANGQSQVRLTDDGYGGVYYVWEDERNNVYPETEIYLQHIDESNNLTFAENGLAICDAPYYQFSPIVRSYDGKAHILWADRRTGSIGLHLQVVAADGIELELQGKEMFFGIDGNGQSPKLTYLGGEALVYWDDRRFSPFENLTFGLKLNDASSLIDNQNGISLTDNPYQSNATVVDTGQNLFLGFGQTDGDINQYYNILNYNFNSNLVQSEPIDLNNQASQEYYSIVHNEIEGLVYYVYSDNREFANNVYVHALNVDGSPNWSAPIKIVETLLDGFLPSDDNVIGAVSNPLGGITILYNSGNFLGTKVYAISIDSLGQVSAGWNSDGTRLCNFDSDQYIESIEPTEFGIFVTFKDNRSGSNDVYVQLISYSGENLFDENGLSIAGAVNDQESSSIAFSTDLTQALICWEDFRLGTEYDVYCRYISYGDGLTWSLSDEFELAGQSNTSGGNQTNPFVFNDGSNFLVAWEDSRNNVYTDIYFQDIKDSQAILTNGGELLCNADFDQLNPKIGKLSSSDGSFLIYWDDLRSSGKEFLNNVFAQSYTPSSQDLSNDLFLDYMYKIKSAYPNPFNPSVSIDFSLDRSDFIKLSVYDIKGRVVSTLLQDFLNIGNYTVDWVPSNEVSSGPYFIRLESINGNLSVSKKIMFIK